MTGIIACKTCGRVHALQSDAPGGKVARCRRCGAVLAKRSIHSLHLTAAFSLAALILYVPANVFPIMRLEMYGQTTTNTVWQGCRRLFEDGQWGIAAIVFLASILIPLLKLMGLFFLTGATLIRLPKWKMARLTLYRIVDGIGRWAMLDVFVMAILVSLVKLQRLATIVPGSGLAAFCAVVVLTLLASASFDPQMIWEDEETAA